MGIEIKLDEIPTTPRDTVIRLSRLYNIPNQAIYNAIRDGELRATRSLCGILLVAKDDFEAWIPNRRKNGRPPKDRPRPARYSETTGRK